MKKAVIITAQGFQDEEFTYPYYRLLEAGFEVHVATKDNEIAKGKYGTPAKPNIDIFQLNEKKYDLVVLPGGYEAPDRVRQLKVVLQFVKAMYDNDKIVAAICHGPWITISAGIMNGKKATCYVGMADDLKNAGAEYIEASVVVDNNLITAPHYDNNGDFMKAILEKF